MMNIEKLEKSDLKNKYFARTEKWDWLDEQMIHIFDSKKPRMITMDPWPQQIYLDAIGDKTIEQYIYHMAQQYPKNKVPEELADTILEIILDLVNDEKIVTLSENQIKLEESILNPLTTEGDVNILGVWNGTYTYNMPDEFKDDKMKEVEFTINIEKVNGKKFYGTVEDNLKTGGTPGVGKVDGKYSNNKMKFNKNMPILGMIDENGNHVTDSSKIHPTICYQGKFSRSKEYITGTWEFKKKKIFWKGLIPHRYSFNGGFTMKKADKN